MLKTPELRGTLSRNLPDFLEKVRGKGLWISILADPSTQVRSGSTATESAIYLPSKQQLLERVTAFTESL